MRGVASLCSMGSLRRLKTGEQCCLWLRLEARCPILSSHAQSELLRATSRPVQVEDRLALSRTAHVHGAAGFVKYGRYMARGANFEVQVSWQAGWGVSGQPCHLFACGSPGYGGST